MPDNSRRNKASAGYTRLGDDNEHDSNNEGTESEEIPMHHVVAAAAARRRASRQSRYVDDPEEEAALLGQNEEEYDVDEPSSERQGSAQRQARRAGLLQCIYDNMTMYLQAAKTTLLKQRSSVKDKSRTIPFRPPGTSGYRLLIGSSD